MDIPRTQRRRLGRRGTLALAGLAVMAVLAAGTAAVGQIQARPPVFARAGLWIGEVERGEMVREVQGNGKLLPEHMQWVTALSAARVEQIFVRPGAAVEADTVLLELRNPDLEMQALEAERQVAAARTVLTTLRATLRSEKLALEESLTTLRGDRTTAQRKAEANAALGERGYVSGDDAHATATQRDSLDRRVGLGEQRLDVLDHGLRARLAAQAEEIERLVAIAAFRREQLAALRVRAGVAGVLQELPLEAGQWVSPGALLAKIARPDHLKAQLQIPETQAKDLMLGQRARVDTRNGVIDGELARIDPAASKGTVTVDVRLDGALPRGARPDLTIVGTVEIERLPATLYVRKPAFVQPDATMSIFRLDPDRPYATRRTVQFGRVSASTVEIVAGLDPGDRIILSDLSNTEGADRIALEE